MKLEYHGVTVTKTSSKDIAVFKKAGYKDVKPKKSAKPKQAKKPKVGE